MPKKILLESAIHQLATAGRRLQERLPAASAAPVAAWLAGLAFDQPGPGLLRVRWTEPAAGEHVITLKSARFYTRGDAAAHAANQEAAGQLFHDDRVMAANRAFFDAELQAMLAAAGLAGAAAATADAGRKHAEEAFHDEWAAGEDVTRIDVRRRNEACTAPEMRHIRAVLGDLRGRELLDVGCGLGEASVYFALEGATVTATDISPGMCAAAQKLAAVNGVTIGTFVSAAEDLGLPADRRFDVIYTGNTLHHADIEAMLDRVLPHLKPDGVFVSWDPVAYNPVINVYRALATQVRTPDEHPLRLRDVRAICARFETAEVRWFWLTTLLVFIWMAVGQGRSPNRERFWKKVVDEADQWAPLYRPLEKLDGWLLRGLPFLRPLCWNVVIVGRRPRLPRP